MRHIDAMKRRISKTLVVSLVLPLLAGSAPASSAAAIRLSYGSILLKAGDRRTVKIKGVSADKINSVVVKSGNTSVAQAEKLSKTKIRVAGIKSGKTSIRVTVKLKKSVRGKKTRNLKMSVKVLGSNGGDTLRTSPSPSFKPDTSQEPIATPVKSPKTSASPTPKSSESPKPTKTPYSSVRLPKQEMNVGETIQIETDAPAGSYTYSAQTNYVYASDCVSISDEGVITGLKAGTVAIYANPSSGGVSKKLGVLHICNNTDPYISISAANEWFHRGVKYKPGSLSAEFKDELGTSKIEVMGSCSKDYMEKHVRLEVEDVTPKAFRRVFHAMGLSTDVLKVASEKNEYTGSTAYMYEHVFDIESNTSNKECPIVSKTVNLSMSRGVRDIKVTVYADETVKDIVHFCLSPYRTTPNDLDVELYDDVRHRIEEKLWTPSMTNYEKLTALSTYINTTAHYPGTNATSKEKNPEYWDDWAVDGIDIHYNLFSTPTLNRAMDLQGGIITCQAADIIDTAATEDLGLAYLYDGNAEETILPCEGVWIGTGAASTNPSAAGHETLWYKDANEQKYPIDTQGMMSSCDKHDCKSKIIPLASNVTSAGLDYSRPAGTACPSCAVCYEKKEVTNAQKSNRELLMNYICDHGEKATTYEGAMSLSKRFKVDNESIFVEILVKDNALVFTEAYSLTSKEEDGCDITAVETVTITKDSDDALCIFDFNPKEQSGGRKCHGSCQTIQDTCNIQGGNAKATFTWSIVDSMRHEPSRYFDDHMISFANSTMTDLYNDCDALLKNKKTGLTMKDLGFGEPDGAGKEPDPSPQASAEPSQSPTPLPSISPTETPGVSDKPGDIVFLRTQSPKGKLVFSWKKAENADGYQIRVSVNRKKLSSAIIYETERPRYVIKSKKQGKAYYIRVRAFSISESGITYGRWSKVRSGKLKR